ncbi:putative E3 ubiquitin-protein ligase RNF167 precursor [Podospora australis]|uniref:E3 ubiquitin-protein ligase RNF167 n=1 Tax=Podospora australis TaxID=1536484 RepID=A0AAN6X3P9_9PEZI|nr:putative E3 ubiquitin-protein ligase RNF167 precursor [Podospora australis]
MTFIHPALLEGARIVARQVTESGISTSAPTAVSPIPTASDLTTIHLSSATAPVMSSSPTSTDPVSSPTPGPGGGGGSGGNNGGGSTGSSPLLFFVALGFGVVFTNLWIIVGVKYCFRYNARSRQMRMNEDGEPINMENMPRPHRRRREKKLMSIDEVNEKFPMVKYKTWVSGRAQEGLPTRGGVSSPSRPNSIRDVDGVIQELPSKERASTEDRPTTSVTAATTDAKISNSNPSATATDSANSEKPAIKTTQHVSKESTSSSVGGAGPQISANRNADADAGANTLHKHTTQDAHDEDDEDDDEHIDAALPPECLGTSGDTCAICIDTLEDDDDVRGLTCGHAFHAACLDPWLTSRRACCPLCKADYYTPKPRAPGAEGADGPTVIAVVLPGDSRSNRMNMPSQPRRTLFGLVRSGRDARNQYTAGRRRDGQTHSSRSRHNRNHTQPPPTTQASASQTAPGGIFSGLRNALPTFGRRTRSNQTQTQPTVSGANPTVTPSQLEAGVRSPAA